jgi:hypothetical protein
MVRVLLALTLHGFECWTEKKEQTKRTEMEDMSCHRRVTGYKMAGHKYNKKHSIKSRYNRHQQNDKIINRLNDQNFLKQCLKTYP